ncbi:excinuclease ABC subunit UvrA [Rubrivirga litoralis]|uniref:UvrABC system protein A n=1 Tax=Rubrivirga litoralis TaxID=3075598 RepID=A0ABU3BLL9_9BACT|nr:excinuclease ABC subunit UvrA [Rubrivirga sp. F394]MDT0630183.1 excinuclease ABC subunit UvrA [Rubrivirga sp. F394]
MPETTAPPAARAKNRFVGRDLVVKGARQHNLKGVDLTIPKRQLVVVTGPSGSGKSSLVFDTIYAEGQRRYVESLSAYARQFLDRMDKPDVDLITGLAPAIAIEQQTGTKNPRSTVATQTEVYDYLRLLYARVGTTVSPVSGEVVTRDSPRSTAEAIQEALSAKTRFYLCFPFPDHKGAKKVEELEALLARGFFRLVALPTEKQAEKGKAPEVLDLNTTPPADVKTPTKRLLVLVDRLATKPGDDATTNRIADSVEQAFREGGERAVVVTAPPPSSGGEPFETLTFSALFERDGMTFEEPTAQLFSFNSPLGACPACQGFGRVPGVDPDLVVPNPELSIRQGAVAPFRTEQWSKHQRTLLRVAAKESVDLDAPYTLLPQEHKDLVWAGRGDYVGVKGFFDYLQKKQYKMHYRIYSARFRGYTRCPACDGYRLRPQALHVKLCGPALGTDGDTTRWTHIGELAELTTADAQTFFESVELSDHDEEVAGRILTEIRKRLGYLVEVGLDYLTLDRLAMALSGGETQRINLATSLGSSLVGSLYVLDEPTIGLHPRDNDRLITILEGLRDIGNTVLVVEHDEQMMRRADQLVDVGPGSGALGGEVMFQGTYDQALDSDDSLTGAYLSGRQSIPVPAERRPLDPNRVITVEGAREHNLKRLTVSFPLDRITVVTGVSGSGKSTLVNATLYTALQRLKGRDFEGKVGAHDAVHGSELIENVEMIDQTPIGKSPRSNPVTYVKAFDAIRDLLASTHQAKIRGYRAGTFSFNVPGGRCEVCQGEGVVQVEMQFLADLYLECEACHGRRFKQDVLEIRYKGKNVAEILDLTVDEAVTFFEGQKRVLNKLQSLQDVGLGYLTLGQPSNTLSGGEAQRVKLASHLSKQHAGHTLYLFDEPTTGLHFDDIKTLLGAFNALVDAGHSVVLIEHNLDVIKAADWVIDIGPEGGRRGGFVVAEGTPEQVADVEASHTAPFLRDALARA